MSVQKDYLLHQASMASFSLNMGCLIDTCPPFRLKASTPGKRDPVSIEYRNGILEFEGQSWNLGFGLISQKKAYH